jgi:hypothetical protein
MVVFAVPGRCGNIATMDAERITSSLDGSHVAWIVQPLQSSE